ncbi:MAG: TetR/AcrR family transcriptional regulator [Spirochaetaceae bacterium]|nr:TetR/AcrR family transcriptional regulator [Spirochaetaceae bacterium]
MPKIVDYEARRNEIAVKAVSIFVRDGFHEANLSKIADLCGFGRTTIYKYFKNKDEIFIYTIEDVFSRLDRMTAAVVEDREASPSAKLETLLGLLVRKAVEEKDRMILILDILLHPERKDPSSSVDAGAKVRALRAALERLIQDGIAAGELKQVNAEAMAFTLFSLVEAATVHNSIYGNFSLEETLGAAKALLEGLRK